MQGEAELIDGLNQLGLYLNTQPMLQYLALLAKWNDAYNLTAIRDIKGMVNRHLLDSLAILPWIQGKRLIDVGTGAGIPGIPIALTHPQLEIVLLDSNGKKIRFLQEVKRALQLDNVEIVQTRVEKYHPALGFDTVISRAFSNLKQMVTWTQHLLAPSGIWLAMKGRHPDEELSDIPNPSEVHQYSVPGVEGERCCVIIKRND